MSGTAARRPRSHTWIPIIMLAATAFALAMVKLTDPACAVEVDGSCQEATASDLQAARYLELGCYALMPLLLVWVLLCLVANQRRRAEERRARTSWPSAPAVIESVVVRSTKDEDGGRSDHRCDTTYIVFPPGEEPFPVRSVEKVERGEPIHEVGDEAVVAWSPDRTRALAVRRPGLIARQHRAMRAELAEHGVLAYGAITDNQPTGRRTPTQQEWRLTYGVYPDGGQPFGAQRAIWGADPTRFPPGLRLVVAFDPADRTRFASWPIPGTGPDPYRMPRRVHGFVVQLMAGRS